MSAWEIGPRVGKYRSIPANEQERIALEQIGGGEFEALSVGRAGNGPQVAIIPLDESSREFANMIAAVPELIFSLKAMMRLVKAAGLDDRIAYAEAERAIELSEGLR